MVREFHHGKQTDGTQEEPYQEEESPQKNETFQTGTCEVGVHPASTGMETVCR